MANNNDRTDSAKQLDRVQTYALSMIEDVKAAGRAYQAASFPTDVEEKKAIMAMRYGYLANALLKTVAEANRVTMKRETNAAIDSVEIDQRIAALERGHSAHDRRLDKFIQGGQQMSVEQTRHEVYSDLVAER